ncbi:hypothetical protein VCHA35O135_20073 [Vibrio chagasii]|nr:hypothetical protein VCHA35O135_20073 [Vibrio chagasii]
MIKLIILFVFVMFLVGVIATAFKARKVVKGK